ncbi:hypothetical protein H6A18_09575 [Collinsella tanakaei]|uniref:hypothetical protein n=1 Tax=Collinsella tanakaei TaxID=626935 RepID=UPI00195BC2D9|nr:hypothetical protein [Collinsella tanakaei]MBM6756751.1 hypothetical protein [Collinsella tanakaei]
MIPETTTQAVPEPPRSTSLWYAVQAGLPVRMSYTLSETARYSGLSEYQLRMAIQDGELTAKAARGTLRGARIPVAAMDAYMAG